MMRVEVLPNIDAVREAVQRCEGNHIQQVAYSSYHDALTQVCWAEGVVRTNYGPAAHLAGALVIDDDEGED